MRAIVVEVAPRWRADGCTTILLASPPLGFADVQAAFDEIDEQCHLEGVDLCVLEHDGHLTATLSKARV